MHQDITKPAAPSCIACIKTSPKQHPYHMQAATDDLDFDPEDADECDDLDDFLNEAISAKSRAARDSDGGQAPLQWNLVRYA